MRAVNLLPREYQNAKSIRHEDPAVVVGSALGVMVMIALGASFFVAHANANAQQAQLTAFFINPPLNSTAGALNPVEAMPAWLQPFTVVNPIHHFAVIARAAAGLTTTPGGGAKLLADPVECCWFWYARAAATPCA